LKLTSYRVALDIYPLTDFREYPIDVSLVLILTFFAADIRKPTGVQTAKGTMLVIPREKGLLRIYIPFGEDGKDATRSGVTLEQARAQVKAAFKPYKFDFERCQWWSAYSLGQRHSEKATDPDSQRIFLCGDAVHNNSPLIGLGLNVSAQDAWNLGWKIALALKAPKALNRKALYDTYEAERLPVAKTLVWYDRNWTSIFNKALVEPGVIIQRYYEFRNFSDAYVLNYPDSALISRQVSDQSVASKLLVGESFTHARVAMHADAQTYWTSSRLEANGQFHIVLLAGDLIAEAQKQRVDALCDKLVAGEGRSSLLYDRYPYCFPSTYYNYDRSDADRGAPKSLINLLTIHTSQQDFPLTQVHEALRGPYHPSFGWDSSRVLIDADIPYDRYCDGTAYETWGVDRSKGALLVLRPDLHIGWAGQLEDYEKLEAYFKKSLGDAWAT
jgi:phenol 2-monooxygenase